MCGITWAQILQSILGQVVQRPISANPGLEFNPGFLFRLFKSSFSDIFSTVFRASNQQIIDKNYKLNLLFTFSYFLVNS